MRNNAHGGRRVIFTYFPMNPHGFYPEFKLDPEGLNESNPEYYSVAFDHLSKEEARAIVAASCSLAREQVWIASFRHCTLAVSVAVRRNWPSVYWKKIR
jgi:hypothetical protein